jgi:ATP-dependent DNA helicase RecG
MIREVLDLMARPFEYERKAGHANSSVMGGLDAYVLSWCRKTKELAGLSALSQKIEKIEYIMRYYRKANPGERAAILDQASLLLRDALDLASRTEAPAPASTALDPASRTEAPAPASTALDPASRAEAPVAANTAGAAAPPPDTARISAKEDLADKARSASGIRLLDPVQFLKGVGPRAASLLGKIGVLTAGDLLFHLPRRWEDRRCIKSIAEAVDGATETLTGTLGPIEDRRIRAGLVITKSILYDDTATLVLTWFNQPYLKRQLRAGLRLIVTGKVKRAFGSIEMTAPELEVIGEDDTLSAGRIVPFYPSTENVSQRYLRKLARAALDGCADLVVDSIPERLRKAKRLLPIQESLRQIHFPDSFEALRDARRRLIYEDLFIVQLGLGLKRREREVLKKGASFIVPPRYLEVFEQSLPYKLTGAQKRVIGEIVRGMTSPAPMHRLVQGDVGSGKTVVAAFALYAAVQCGYQGAIMAPTEILAHQHFRKFREILEPLDVSVGLLTGSLRKKAREKIHEGLKSGTLSILVGTHAVIQESVTFRNLGFAVVDEQHKFGVMQRTTLREKGSNPDLLVMTATPIPRTLALTLYGDLEISVIDELPPGRQVIKSYWARWSQRERVYNFIRKEVAEGRQAYVVCPLVEESDKLKVSAAVEEAETLRSQVFPDLRVGLLHGRMRAEEKEQVMRDFLEKRYEILISTTVIEVGVDVPNATLMLVQNAERFGLSQLHQLRGRVGRGAQQSYCIFLSDPGTEEGVRRMKVIAGTSDGFRIAQEDLELRGAGEFYGTRQSGMADFLIADLIRDHAVLEEAKVDVDRLLASDPFLMKEEHRRLRRRLEEKFEGIFERFH